MDVFLAEDELKILISILDGLSYKPDGAKIVLPIIEKLKKQIKEPELVPDEPVEPTTPDPVISIDSQPKP